MRFRSPGTFLHHVVPKETKVRDEGDYIICGFTPPSLSPEPDPTDCALIRALRAGYLATCWDFLDVIVGGGECYIPGPDVRRPRMLSEPFSPSTTYILLGVEDSGMKPPFSLAGTVIVQILKGIPLRSLVGFMIVANLGPDQFEKGGPCAGILRPGKRRGRYDMEIAGYASLARNVGPWQVFGIVVAFP